MEKVKFFRTGKEDFWGNEIVSNEKGIEHQMVDGYPHTITDWGEPLYPIINFQIVENDK